MYFFHNIPENYHIIFDFFRILSDGLFILKVTSILAVSCRCVFLFVLFVCLFAFKSVLKVISLTYLTILEAIICFFSIWSIVGLTGFHGYLVASNQTTNEDVSEASPPIHCCEWVFVH